MTRLAAAVAVVAIAGAACGTRLEHAQIVSGASRQSAVATAAVGGDTERGEPSGPSASATVDATAAAAQNTAGAGAASTSRSSGSAAPARNGTAVSGATPAGAKSELVVAT